MQNALRTPTHTPQPELRHAEASIVTVDAERLTAPNRVPSVAPGARSTRLPTATRMEEQGMDSNRKGSPDRRCAVRQQPHRD
jgi:hypothetical protein